MIQAESPALVLASSSGIRRGLMAAAGLLFTAEAAAVDEASIKEAAQAEGLSPADAALVLADAKAMRIARKRPEALVIGADQLLVCEGRWFDKPESVQAARGHLLALRGKTHELVTATVAWRHGARVWQHVAVPRMAVRAFSDEFLDEYLAIEGERVMCSVGAYRLEGMGMHLFSRIEGEHAAILGLPMLALLDFLRGHGVLAR